MTYVEARINGSRCSAEVTAVIYSLQAEIEDLKSGLANYRELHAERDALRDHIHTCGPTCSKAGCVNTRLRGVAQMALEAISDSTYVYQYTHIVELQDLLRKELGK